MGGTPHLDVADDTTVLMTRVEPRKIVTNTVGGSKGCDQLRDMSNHVRVNPGKWTHVKTWRILKFWNFDFLIFFCGWNWNIIPSQNVLWIISLTNSEWVKLKYRFLHKSYYEIIPSQNALCVSLGVQIWVNGSGCTRSLHKTHYK